MPYPLEVLIKLVVAVGLGGLVGWQRETHDRPAGLRTHILVCVGSAIYTLASLSFGPNADPGRIASQVATGMGFLGAGTIIRHGNVVRGLTTAASLWAVAAVGICVAIGGELYWVAVLGMVMVLITLAALSKAEAKLLRRGRQVQVTLHLASARERLGEIQKTIAASGITIDSIQITDPDTGEPGEIQLNLRLPTGADLANLSAALARLPGCISLRSE